MKPVVLIIAIYCWLCFIVNGKHFHKRKHIDQTTEDDDKEKKSAWDATNMYSGTIISLDISDSGQFIGAVYDIGQGNPEYSLDFAESYLFSNFNTGISQFSGIACSSSGQNMTLVGPSNSIAISYNYGVNYTVGTVALDSPSDFTTVALSADSKYVFIGSSTAYFYISSNYGLSYTALQRYQFANAISIACSDDGQYILVSTGSNAYESDPSSLPYYLSVSTDFGATWQSPYTGEATFSGVAISANGQYMYAARSDQQLIYISSDYGSSWSTSQHLDAVASGFYSVACDSTGQYVVLGSLDIIYQSATFGQSWYLTFTMNPLYDREGIYSFYEVVSSASGEILYATYRAGLLWRNTSLDVVYPTISTTSRPSQMASRVPSTVAPTVITSVSQVQALQALYDATDGPHWSFADFNDHPYYAGSDDSVGVAWNFSEADPNPCYDNWVGVLCQSYGMEYVITELQLSGLNLVGSIPDVFAGLPELETINLSNNTLWGTIPESIYDLEQIEKLHLTYNLLTGTIGAALFEIPSIEEIDLSYNLFNGSLPNNFSSLGAGLTYSFVYVEISNNMLTGSFPSSMAYWMVDFLDFSFNQLSGSLPSSMDIYDCMEVDLSNNQLTGEIPSGLCNVYLNNNYFTGWYQMFTPFDGQSFDVFSIDVDNNLIQGTVPPEIGLLTSVQNIVISNNLLSGQLPNASLIELTDLAVFDCSYNRFTGPLPYNMSLLNYYVYTNSLNFSNNYFSGTVPLPLLLNLRGAPNVLSINVSNNALTALPSVADVMDTISTLFSMDISNNPLDPIDFTGYPDVYVYLMYLYADNTTQTGQISSALAGLSLSYLSLTNNYFTGTIPEELATQTYLTLLLLNNNLLSGTIPALGDLERLIALYLQDNVLSGSVPSDFSNLGSLQSLLLFNNRLTGNLNIFNATIQSVLQSIDISNNAFSGSLPEQLFLLPSLTSFAAVSNCLQGSLPSTLCTADLLEALVMDGMKAASDCQKAYFPHFQKESSYHESAAIEGGIPDCLFSMPSLVTLHLAGNGLTGTLPSYNGKLTDLSLSHNLLSGSISKQLTNNNWSNFDLSYNNFRDVLKDHFQGSYSSGTVTLQVNHLSGAVPSQLFHTEAINILDGNLFSCDISRSNLPRHDKNYDTYSCGSDSFSDAFYSWLAILFCLLIVVYALVRKCKSKVSLFSELIALSETCDGYNNVKLVSAMFGAIRKFVLGFTLYSLLVLIPVYVALTLKYGNYIHEYVWITSEIYLNGPVVGAVLIALYILLLLGSCYGWHILFRDLHGSSLTSVTTETNEATKSSLNSTALLVAMRVTLFLLDAAVMVMLNVGYVLISINYNQSTVHLSQVAVSLIKLVWNEAIVHRILKNIDVKEAHDPVIGKAALGVMMVIFNNVMAPFVATAVVSSDCFYNLLFPASPVTSSYSYEECTSFNFVYSDVTGLVESAYCAEYTTQVRTTSFTPPFVYSYQCSSAFISTYSNVYIFMFLLMMLSNPFQDAVLTFLRLRYSKSMPSWWWRIFPHVNVSRFILAQRVDDDKMKLKDDVTANQRKFNTVGQVCSVLSLLWSFGVVVPLLALVGCVTFFAVTYYQQLCLGLIISQTEDEALKVKLERECTETLSSMQHSVRYTFPYLGLFYFLILFDIEHSYVAPVAVVGALSAAWIGMQALLWKCKSDVAAGGRDKTRETVIEMESIRA